MDETILIDGREQTTLGILLDNLDGLVFAFTLEPVIMMLHMTRADDGPRKHGWFVGFFGQWWHERKEFGSLRPLGRIFAEAEPVFESILTAGTAVGHGLTDGLDNAGSAVTDGIDNADALLGTASFLDHQDRIANAEAVLVNRGSDTSSSYGVV